MAPAKKLYLHIGLHKTGTSAIQHALFHAREALAAKGVLYPKSVAWLDHSHHSLLLPFWRKEAFDEPFEQLSAEINASPCSTVLISSELFPNIYTQGDRFTRLWQMVSTLAEEIEVILYVRRQDRLAASVFKQWCKSDDVKLAVSPADFISDDLRINMNIEKYCVVWSELPGVTALHMRSYDHERKNLVSGFLDILGLPRDIVSGLENVRANPTMDGEQLIFRHYFNGFDLDQDTSNALLSYILGHLSPKPRLEVFSRDMRKALMERHAKTNNIAFEKHGAKCPPFDDQFEESGHVFRKPSTPEVLDFFMKLSHVDIRLAAHLFDQVMAAGTAMRNGEGK